MKNIVIATALLLSTSHAFAETVILVGCNCSYYSDYVQRNVLAVGTRTNPSPSELLECVINEGKVISGCDAAKMNVRLNCEESVRNILSSADAGRISVQVNEESCAGQISKD